MRLHKAKIPIVAVGVIAYVVALPSGLAFALPMGTPPNAIAFSSRFFRLREMLRAGILLNGIAVCVLLLIVRFYWPLLGLKWW